MSTKPKPSQKTVPFLPFNKPSIVGKELDHVKDCILKGHTAGDGEYTKKAEALLAKVLNAKHVLLTPSGTAALELAALALDIQAGDEVIMPSFTFVSTANAIVLRGAKPVFVDVRPDTLNMDENKIEELVTEKTKAILPVHYAGIACEMNKIGEIAKKYNLKIIEDAAHALFGKYEDQALGSIGDANAFSFHETKNFICGEGGALVINDSLLEKDAVIMREKGTNRTAFLRGEVDKYSWVNIGSSYLMSDILAAFLYGQLSAAEKIRNKREKIHTLYYDSLKPLADSGYLRLPITPGNCTPNHHIFYIMLNDFKTREALRNFLKEKNIHAVFHYIPLHSSEFGKKIHPADRNLPITDSASDTILRLPVFYELSRDQQEYIISSIFEFFETQA